MKFLTSELTTPEIQYYLQHLVAPRPVCFASTIDGEGKVNLSPFSFFNLFSNQPPIVVFSPAKRLRNNTHKHTLENILEVPEVVINIVSYDMVHQTSLASCEYPRGINEFVKAGFTPQQASLVKPPMVQESKAKLECRVTEVKSLGDNGGAGQLIIAEVLCIHINDELITADKKILQDRLDLVARLGANWYARITASNLFEVQKPNTQLAIGFDSLPSFIRNSRILSGNDLAQLANVNEIPQQDQAFYDERLDAMTTYLKDDNKIEKIHTYAKELIATGEILHAWQVLLSQKNLLLLS